MNATISMMIIGAHIDAHIDAWRTIAKLTPIACAEFFKCFNHQQE